MKKFLFIMISLFSLGVSHVLSAAGGGGAAKHDQPEACLNVVFQLDYSDSMFSSLGALKTTVRNILARIQAENLPIAVTVLAHSENKARSYVACSDGSHEDANKLSKNLFLGKSS